MSHTPVVLNEALARLALRPGLTVVDATVGGGGHSEALLEATAPDGVLVAIDRDPSAIDAARVRLARFGGRIRWVTGDYGDVATHVAAVGPPHAILADCGLSSLQLDDASRGFSFLREGPLDMRYGPEGTRTAAAVVNGETPERLADLFFHFGGEHASRRIARWIAQRRRERPFETTTDLADGIARLVGRGRRTRIHPATRVFQALRIAVNDELGSLGRLLAAAPRCLAPGGRLAVIAFHSLEDRCVKQSFREGARNGVWRIVTPKPVRPSREERTDNPRARSAKLRVAERLPPGPGT